MCPGGQEGALSGGPLCRAQAGNRFLQLLGQGAKECPPAALGATLGLRVGTLYPIREGIRSGMTPALGNAGGSWRSGQSPLPSELPLRAPATDHSAFCWQVPAKSEMRCLAGPAQAVSPSPASCWSAWPGLAGSAADLSWADLSWNSPGQETAAPPSDLRPLLHRPSARRPLAPTHLPVSCRLPR